MSNDSDKYEFIEPPENGEPYLLTPGPLTTSATVKQAMLKDWGSWDEDFRSMTRALRSELLEMLDDSDGEYECVPLQGSGTYVVEAMLGTLLARNSKSLVLVNGAYGQRIASILLRIGRRYAVIDKGDYEPPRGDEVASALRADPDLTHVIVVHCETSSGILNPIEEISEAVEQAGRKLLVDSMSGFGALPLSPASLKFEAIASSANKCIESVPGFGFILVRRSTLEASSGNCHSLSLDLHDQWVQMEKTGQWRYTPPTHVIAASLEALKHHRRAGGVKGRLQRYTANCNALVSGMRALGFVTLLDDCWLSPIIVTFFNPAHQNFSFESFYGAMKTRGFIIYPGKLTHADSFRIGCIGQMNDEVMRAVVKATADSLREMGVPDGAPTTAVKQQSQLEELA